MSGKFTPAPIPSHGSVMITLKPVQDQYWD
jgi:hypothetical protein